MKTKEFKKELIKLAKWYGFAVVEGRIESKQWYDNYIVEQENIKVEFIKLRDRKKNVREENIFGGDDECEEITKC